MRYANRARARLPLPFALAIAAAAVVAFSAGPLAAAIITPVTTADGTGADAYVRDGSYSDVTHGSEGSVVIKNASAGFGRKGYLRFDLSGVDTALIRDAALDLTVSLNNGVGDWTVNVYGLNDQDAGEG